MVKAKRASASGAKVSASNKRSLNAIVRLNIEPIGVETKAELVEKLLALQSENAVKKYFLVGSNTVAKALDANNVAVLVVPKDSLASVVNHLVESAMWKKVHVVVVPKFVIQLREILNLRCASCFAIPLKPVTAASTSIEMEEEMVSSRVDAFKDFLLAA